MTLKPPGSTIQYRVSLSRKPRIAAIASGTVVRSDSDDALVRPIFDLKALAMDEAVSVALLNRTLEGVEYSVKSAVS